MSEPNPAGPADPWRLPADRDPAVATPPEPVTLAPVSTSSAPATVPAQRPVPAAEIFPAPTAEPPAPQAPYVPVYPMPDGAYPPTAATVPTAVAPPRSGAWALVLGIVAGVLLVAGGIVAGLYVTDRHRARQESAAQQAQIEQLQDQLDDLSEQLDDANAELADARQDVADAQACTAAVQALVRLVADGRSTDDPEVSRVALDLIDFCRVTP